MDIVIENIVEALNKSYCGLEDAYGNHDITKDDFIKAENLMSLIAQSIGINEYYPFRAE